MNKLKQEKQVLVEMIEWLNKRIIEMQGNAPAYEEMKNGLELELNIINEKLNKI
jgi:hypothetical protein